jgi:surfactin synthase thioesterase subunit
MEIWIAHYPGRGSRYHETPIRKLTLLAQKFCQMIQPLLDKPFAFFGHSLGGLAAFELTRQLRQQEFPQPQYLFVSACGAPHLPDPNPRLHDGSDAEFINSLQELNGLPAELLDQPAVMHLFLPVLRADFEAGETYRYSADGSPLHIPILALAGLEDPLVSRERIAGWASHTDVSFQSQYFPGDHFFINTSREAVIASIAAELVTPHEKK